jgi:putative ABC transport system permease protein
MSGAIMFKNHIKLALRNLYKDKAFSFINLSGLAIGLACFILIMVWVQDELSFDRFHKSADRLYRITMKNAGMDKFWAITPLALSDVIKTEYPEIENSARCTNIPIDYLFEHQEQKIEFGAAMVDPAFFKMFTFPLIHGDPETAMDDPFSIILTEGVADKLLPGENPVGQVISFQFLNNVKYDLKITGLIENLPHNSHLQAESFIPYEFLKVLMPLNDWNNYMGNTYIMLPPNFSPQVAEQDICNCLQNNLKGKDAAGLVVHLQPIKDIHLFSDLAHDTSVHGDIKYVYLFSIIAAFILIIACINFMNLATARSIKRAKEIGLRKVVGADRSKIIFQFLGESLLFVILAFILSIVLVEIVLPSFGEWAGKNLEIDYLNGWYIVCAVALIFLTGIMAAGYPAFFLSAFQPVRVLNANKSSGSKSIFRKVLVAVQFSLSIMIIIGSIVVWRQLDYVQNANLGYGRENLIYIKMQGQIRSNYETVKNDLLQNPNVISAAANEFITNDVMQGTNSISWEGKRDDQDVRVHLHRVDYDFLKTFDIELSQGRFFSQEFSTDASQAFVINETAAKAMGLDSPVDKYFRLWGQQGKIIGVVKDFHFQSLHNNIEPLVLWMNTDFSYNGFQYMTVRIKSADMANTINDIKSVWRKHSPDYPFIYKFYDETLAAQYDAEQRIGKLFNGFTLLAIIISCLGLLGLISFVTEQKTKEIGIRKVLGASIPNLIRMLLKDFAAWILLANLIAWPVAFYVMNKWLQNFAYRINMSWWIFALAGGIALAIALLTVGTQAIRAAMANPVESLRYE